MHSRISDQFSIGSNRRKINIVYIINMLRLLCILALVCWSELEAKELGSNMPSMTLESCGNRPEVTTAKGTICGVECPGGPSEICSNSSITVKFKAFSGIPFAKPPVRDLRFKSPVPVERWPGYRNGGWMPPRCPQSSPITEMIRGQEDCLYLNVYVPENTGCKKFKDLPVMVWIHGGGYSIGGIRGMSYANKLMTRDVILVTIQYRLGILGFLSTNDDIAPGNLALKDQELALHWVHDNIANFGGDPNKVTIFGQSAGAMSVHLQMLNPSAKGLFSRAIMQSGTALLPMFREVNHKKAAVKVAKELATNISEDECPPNLSESSSSEDIIRCLQDIPDASSFVRVIEKLGVFGPVPYGLRYGEVSLPGTPEQLLRTGNYHKVDVMMGTTQHDGGWITKFMLCSYSGKFDDIRNNYLNMDKEKAYVARQMLQYYLNGIRKYGEEDADKLTEMFTDYFFKIPHDYTLGLHARDSLYGGKVYSYELKHKGEYNIFNDIYPKIGQQYVDHSEEMQFLLTDHDNTGENKKFENMMLDLWTNFATNGNPTPDASYGFTWQPVSLESTDHLVLKVPQPYMEADTRYQRRKFMSNLDITMNQALFPEQGPLMDYMESLGAKVFLKKMTNYIKSLVYNY